MQRGTWGAIALILLFVGIGLMWLGPNATVQLVGAGLTVLSLGLFAHSNTKE